MTTKKIKEFLDQHKTKYVNIKHSPAYTAQEIAHSAHIPGDELAKTVVVKVNGGMAMIVTTANEKLNFPLLQKAMGKGKVELASEREFQDKFPGCEVGAMPPFGELFGMDVYVDKRLSKDKEIVFNAGSHSELIRMTYKDFEKLVHPNTVNL